MDTASSRLWQHEKGLVHLLGRAEETLEILQLKGRPVRLPKEPKTRESTHLRHHRMMS
jgi:hypothetical protein